MNEISLSGNLQF